MKQNLLLLSLALLSGLAGHGLALHRRRTIPPGTVALVKVSQEAESPKIIITPLKASNPLELIRK